MLRILIVEPRKPPREATIDNNLESMQSIVGGLIQAVYPFSEPVALVCNDEGKFLGLPPNRALRDDRGNAYDIICGTFFVCAAPPGSSKFKSLSDEQIVYYKQYFQRAEYFLTRGELI